MDSNDEEHTPRPEHLESEALILGYVMSRENEEYLRARSLRTWQDAFREAGTALGVRPASIKNLRDEFDPLHENGRKGWRNRAVRADRLRIFLDLSELSSQTILALADRILARDGAATEEVVSVIAAPPLRHAVQNIEKRLLTGATAEAFFLRNSFRLVGVQPSDLLDRRNAACGYDFAVRGDDTMVFEVKGMAGQSGGLSFTEREWNEASIRREQYQAVVVGDVDALIESQDDSRARSQIVPDPTRNLPARCLFRTTVTATWQSPFKF